MTGHDAHPVTVLLVDDHAVVREGYRRLLERDGGISVIGEGADAATAYAGFCTLDPDVVVLDITLPGSSGIEVARRMLAHQPAARILVFSMHEDAIFATRSLQAGAFGYVTKASAPHVLVEAVHAVAAGHRYLSPDIAHKLALRDFGTGKSDALSSRELDVLRLLVKGQTVREIASSLDLSAKTVANLQSNIKQKLAAGTMIELLKRAGDLGLKS